MNEPWIAQIKKPQNHNADTMIIWNWMLLEENILNTSDTVGLGTLKTALYIVSYIQAFCNAPRMFSMVLEHFFVIIEAFGRLFQCIQLYGTQHNGLKLVEV